MKAKRWAAVLAILCLLGAATPVLAGGDKQRGDVGAGAVAQEHVNWQGYERRPYLLMKPAGASAQSACVKRPAFAPNVSANKRRL